MYRGFNLNFNGQPKFDETYGKAGEAVLNTYKADIQDTLKGFISNDGFLDGSKMQSNWFPQVKTDIFISHSHTNTKRAIALAGWLHKRFGLTAFVDSCIWGYANDLLKIVDKKYCYDDIKRTYNYNLRNNSTSHIHMMLSTALMMMIDNSECLIFLKSSDSVITASDTINKTASPWIYSEIAITQVIRQQLPKRIINLQKGGVLNESLLRILYDVNLAHLTEVDENTLIEWSKSLKQQHPLDTLYDLKPIRAILKS